MPLNVFADDGDEANGDITRPVEVKNENKTVNENITVENANALTVNASDEGNAGVTVTGDITAKSTDSEDNSSGVVVNATLNSTANVTVNGDVTADTAGINIVNKSGSYVEVIANGNVSGGDNGIAIAEDITATSDTKVTVAENVEKTGESQGSAISVESGINAHNNIIDVGGSVNSTGDGISVMSVNFSKDKAETTINVDGGVESDKVALAITAVALSESDGNNVTVRIGEDLTANDSEAIRVLLNVKKEDSDNVFVGNATVIVEGTISSGDENAVITTDTRFQNDEVESNLETLDLTVWKINIKDGQKLAVDTKKVEDVEFEKQINYIIKIEPNKNADFSAVKKDGSVLDTVDADINGKSYSYNVANENDEVYLKINSLAKGYKLKGAYNGEGEKAEIDQDTDGNYYIKVPRGGGVYLSVEVEPDASDKESSDDVEPKPSDDKTDDKTDDKADENNRSSSAVPAGDYILPVIDPALNEQVTADERTRRIPNTSDETDLRFWTILLLAMMGTAFVSSMALIKTEE